VEVAHGDVEKEWPFTEPFDAITCYTISNFTKPSLVLKNISKNLRDGGYFFFNIPDCDNFISKLLGDRFYVYRPCAAVSFSKKTFTAYLEDNGFEIERMVKDTQQVPIKRLFGMIGLPSVANMLNFYGVGNLDFKIALPTSYIGCAVLKKNKLP
jgi:SAM-dependent methyltransferase